MEKLSNEVRLANEQAVVASVEKYVMEATAPQVSAMLSVLEDRAKQAIEDTEPERSLPAWQNKFHLLPDAVCKGMLREVLTEEQLSGCAKLRRKELVSLVLFLGNYDSKCAVPTREIEGLLLWL